MKSVKLAAVLLIATVAITKGVDILSISGSSEATIQTGVFPSGMQNAGAPYVIITGSDAHDSGITLTGSAANYTGTVANWNWPGNTNASPSSSSGQTETLTFTYASIGQSNAISLTITHNDPNGNVCLTNGANPQTQIWIQVLGEQLAFNFSNWQQSSPTTGTPVQQQVATQSGYTFLGARGNLPTINTEYDIVTTSGTLNGITYEYDATINTPSSMVAGSDMDIYESGTLVSTGYDLSMKPYPIPSLTDTGTFDYVTQGFTNLAGDPAPANPILYAFDSPGIYYGPIISAFNNTNAMLAVITSSITLTSYPIWQRRKAGDSVLHSFTYVAVPTWAPLLSSGSICTNCTISGTW